jgi:hypothetical protein
MLQQQQLSAVDITGMAKRCGVLCCAEGVDGRLDENGNDTAWADDFKCTGARHLIFQRSVSAATEKACCECQKSSQGCNHLSQRCASCAWHNSAVACCAVNMIRSGIRCRICCIRMTAMCRGRILNTHAVSCCRQSASSTWPGSNATPRLGNNEPRRWAVGCCTDKDEQAPISLGPAC